MMRKLMCVLLILLLSISVVMANSREYGAPVSKGFERTYKVTKAMDAKFYNHTIKKGDTVKVHVKIREGEKERIQIFQGVVIKKTKGFASARFTVRKISGGIGVERIFPLFSPSIDKIEVITRGRVRRSKLYYLRNLRGKAARIKEKRFA